MSRRRCGGIIGRLMGAAVWSDGRASIDARVSASVVSLGAAECRRGTTATVEAGQRRQVSWPSLHAQAVAGDVLSGGESTTQRRR